MKLIIASMATGFAIACGLLGVDLSAEARWQENGESIARRTAELSGEVASSPSTGPALPMSHIDASANGREVKLNYLTIAGVPTRVCTTDSDVISHLRAAAKVWKDRLKGMLSFTGGEGPFNVVDRTTPAGSNCPVSGDGDVHVVVVRIDRSGGIYYSKSIASPPHRRFETGDNAPMSLRTDDHATIAIPDSKPVAVSTLVHELGHVLGLRDYLNCNELRGTIGGSADPDPNNQHFALMYNASDRDCRPPAQATITGRDLRDLYEAYHVGAVERVELVANPTIQEDGGLRIQFRWPNDPLGVSGLAEASHNGLLLLVMRQASAGADWVRVGDVTNPVRIWASDPPSSSDMIPRLVTVTDPAGRAHRYKIVGLTRGDVRWQNTLHSGREFDETVTHDGITYQLGDPTIVAGVGVSTTRRVLSASLSPRYCFTDGLTRGTIRESQFQARATIVTGLESASLTGVDGQGLSGPGSSRVYSCGTGVGERSFTAAAE